VKERPLLVLAIVLALSCLAALPYLRGDGNGYYAWLRSPAIDGDLQFGDEFAHGDPAFLATVYAPDGAYLPGMITETDHVRDQWSVGPAVLWAPFFLLGHVIVLIGGLVGKSWPQDGFSGPYLWAVAIGSALYAAAGLLLSASAARQLFPMGPVTAGVIAIWLGSSLPVYQYLLPFWPFACGVFVAALLLSVWMRGGWRRGHWFLVGFLAALMVTIHPLGVAWLALPATSVLGTERGTARQRAVAVAFGIVGAAVGALPELIGKAIVNGSPLDTGYQAEWDFPRPHLLRVLVGAEHGLLSWTPILAFALLGLIWVWRADRHLGIGLVAVFAAMLYLVAAYATPEQSSYGNRFFVLFTPGFVLGAAGLASALWRRRQVLIATIAIFIVWNVLFMFQWSWGLVPKRGPVDWTAMASQQFTTAPREMAHAVRLFFTDRGELIRIVQERDLEQLRSGQDTSGAR
jgi:hypothetical protein